MDKMDFKRNILPDIEMYGGDTDRWEIPLYFNENRRMLYSEMSNYTFTLTIKDYGYTHRPNGSNYFTLIKQGSISMDDDGSSAVLTFQLAKNDTIIRDGKFTYQITAETTDGQFRNSAQGELLIIKSIDQ